MADTPEPYDTTELAALGRRYRSGTDILKKIRPLMVPAIVDAHRAGVPVSIIATLAGMSEERVRQIVTARPPRMEVATPTEAA